MSMMLFMKDARGLLKSIDLLDSTLKLPLIVWSTHFLWAFCRASTASAIYFNLSEIWKFSEICVLFEMFFFWHESQPAGPIMKTKKVNVE